jgi:hypothetical protein
MNTDQTFARSSKCLVDSVTVFCPLVLPAMYLEPLTASSPPILGNLVQAPRMTDHLHRTIGGTVKDDLKSDWYSKTFI